MFYVAHAFRQNIDHCHSRFIYTTGFPTRVTTVYWSRQLIQKGSFMVIPQLTFKGNTTFYGISYQIRYHRILDNGLCKVSVIIEIYQCCVYQWPLALTCFDWNCSMCTCKKPTPCPYMGCNYSYMTNPMALRTVIEVMYRWVIIFK